MAKKSNMEELTTLAEAPFAMHIAQETLGKGRSEIITDVQVTKTEYCRVVNDLLSTEVQRKGQKLNFHFEQSVVLQVFGTLVHCFFENGKKCDWTAIFLYNEDKAEEFKRLIDRVYTKNPDEANTWINYDMDTIVTYFYDDEHKRYVIGFLPVNLIENGMHFKTIGRNNYDLN